MDANQLLLLTVLLFGTGALASLLLSRSDRVARVTAGLTGALASGVGLVAAAEAVAVPPAALDVAAPLPFGHFTLQMDGLSTLLVGIICALGLAVSIYSMAYFTQHSGHRVGLLGFFTNLFMAMMLLVVTVGNAFYFLVFWEVMTLASYFAVIFESGKPESIRAGYLYMLVAHAATALIMLAFFIFYAHAGSFDFTAFRQTPLPPAVRSLLFVLAFAGFGAKAGVVPFHFWLPRAYAAAPSPIAALLSGAMMKTAVYGILRLGVDILGGSVLWWGLLVLICGALSAVLGVFFALAERDVKRLLAYSSVENVGIILMGVGTGMIGLAADLPAVALLGFLAALYHILSHSFFKGLLFLGAGALDLRVRSRNLDSMGGLGRPMPWTGLAFLIGVLAFAAIPPFTGFVSEWLTYQSFFAASQSDAFVVRVALPLAVVVLALVGALALMVAIKMYGAAFTGPARSKPAAEATEVPGTMLTGLGILALGCVALGLGAPLVAPRLASIATEAFGASVEAVAAGPWVYPVEMGVAVLSTPLIALLLAGLLVIPLLLVTLYGGHRTAQREVDDPWACGYGYGSQMSTSASSFDQPVAVTFRWIYRLGTLTRQPLSAIAAWAGRARGTLMRAEPGVERIVSRPPMQAVDAMSRRIQTLAMGDVRIYCLYIVLTLIVLLIAIFH